MVLVETVVTSFLDVVLVVVPYEIAVAAVVMEVVAVVDVVIVPYEIVVPAMVVEVIAVVDVVVDILVVVEDLVVDVV